MSGDDFSKKNLLNFLDYSPVGSYLIQDYCIVFFNEKACDILGYNKNEIIGKNIMDLVHYDDFYTVKDNILKRLEENWPYVHYNAKLLHKDGYYVNLDFMGTYIYYENRKSIAGFFKNPEEQRLMEKELIESEIRYRTIFEKSRYPKLIIDPANGDIVDANEAAESFYGYSNDELTSMNISKINMLPHSEILFEMENARKQNRNYFVFKHMLKNRKIKDVEVYTTPFEIDDEEFLYSTIYDITEKNKVFAELLKTRELLISILQNSKDSIFVVNKLNQIIYINPSAEELTGVRLYDVFFEDVHDLFMPEKYSEDYRKGMEIYKKTGKGSAFGKTVSVEMKDINGNNIPVEISLSKISIEDNDFVMAIVRDVSEKKHLEKQLVASQRMEAVGQLAGGVAHDFNNFLTGLMAYIDMLMGSKRLDEEEKDYLSQMMQLTERSSKLVENLLAFSRRQASFPQIVDVNRQLSIGEKLYNKMITEKIDLTVEYSDVPVYIKIDPVQLDQIILNFISNARDAIRENGEIKIILKLCDADVIIKHNDSIIPGYGKYCQLIFSDDGLGMPQDVKEKIFEPFFTTKEINKGTGLGLATVYGIVKQNNGYIFCESEPGEGTSFYIYFPLVEEANKKERSGASAKVEHVTSGEKILLCEDDDGVRRVLSKMLDIMGFKIIEAINGEEGLRIFQENLEDIACVISDYIMPYKNGINLFEEINKIKPGIPFILTSGYSYDGENLTEITRHKNCKFLKKPIKPDLLKNTIGELINSGNN